MSSNIDDVRDIEDEITAEDLKLIEYLLKFKPMEPGPVGPICEPLTVPLVPSVPLVPLGPSGPVGSIGYTGPGIGEPIEYLKFFGYVIYLGNN